MMLNQPNNRVVATSLRIPHVEDGPYVHQLVQECPPLDVNSCYCYTLLCDQFAQTSAIAESADRILGYCSGFCEPSRPDTLFIWQVAIHAVARGQGLAKRLLRHILERPAMNHITRMRTTVSSSNAASRGLFRSLAADYGAMIEEHSGYEEHVLSLDGSHEAEPFLLIGPLTSDRK